jgi:hypothetical protein
MSSHNFDIMAEDLTGTANSTDQGLIHFDLEP